MVRPCVCDCVRCRMRVCVRVCVRACVIWLARHTCLCMFTVFTAAVAVHAKRVPCLAGADASLDVTHAVGLGAVVGTLHLGAIKTAEAIIAIAGAVQCVASTMPRAVSRAQLRRAKVAGEARLACARGLHVDILALAMAGAVARTKLALTRARHRKARAALCAHVNLFPQCRVVVRVYACTHSTACMSLHIARNIRSTSTAQARHLAEERRDAGLVKHALFAVLGIVGQAHKALHAIIQPVLVL